ncbi:MAG: hypothetical protein IKU39_01970 [Lachnospiraceae bacterium]|nr:hypothetical protein [Lachnospiraceae bacterium]
MIVDVNKKILIVGLGLLGGSYTKALKHKEVDCRRSQCCTKSYNNKIFNH